MRFRRPAHDQGTGQGVRRHDAEDDHQGEGAGPVVEEPDASDDEDREDDERVDDQLAHHLGPIRDQLGVEEVASILLRHQ